MSPTDSSSDVDQVLRGEQEEPIAKVEERASVGVADPVGLADTVAESVDRRCRIARHSREPLIDGHVNRRSDALPGHWLSTRRHERSE